MEEKQKKKRRARGEGSIRWVESKKLYEARYPAGVDENGKTIYKSIYGKKMNKVLKQMREALAALGKGEYVDPSDMSLIAWCKQWFEIYKKPLLKRFNTIEKYSNSIIRLNRYDIANVQLKNLNQEIIQKFYNFLAEAEGLDEETIRATHTLVKGALSKADELGKVNKNEALGCKIPKTDIFNEESKEARALTEEQEKAFLYELGRRTKHFMYALLMDNTGLRPGEALALSRSDVDFIRKIVPVTKTYIERLRKVQNVPKTASSRRNVPLPDKIIPLLREYMMKQPDKKPDAPLFQTDRGKRPTMSYLRKRFKYAGKAIGCNWVNLHTMRHTFASKLFRMGIDIKVISKLLGHKDVSTTYNIYIHFIDNIVEDSVQVLNDGLPDKLPKKTKKKSDNVIQLKEASTH